MKRRSRLADALFGEPEKSNRVVATPTSLDDLRSTITVHRASQRYSSDFEGVFEFRAVVVDVNPTRVHVDAATAERLAEITGEVQHVWTFYRGAFVVNSTGAPLDYELYFGDTVAPRVTMRSYDKGRKWSMDVHNIHLIVKGVHFST